MSCRKSPTVCEIRSGARLWVPFLIGFVLLESWGDQSEARRIQGNQLTPEEQPKRTSKIGVCMALGMSFGCALGVAWGNIAIGVALGPAFGLLVGAVLDARANKRDGD